MIKKAVIKKSYKYTFIINFHRVLFNNFLAINIKMVFKSLVKTTNDSNILMKIRKMH